MRGVLIRLLDRGWDAHWVMSQPLCRLVGMLGVIVIQEQNQIKQRGYAQKPIEVSTDIQTKTFKVAPDVWRKIRDKRQNKGA